MVRSAFALDDQPGEEEENATPRTISINTRLMWDVLLYNITANRGRTTLPQSGGLFNGSSFFPDDDIGGEGEDILEMEISQNPTVEVILSNGQALPPQSGQRKSPANLNGTRGAHGSHAQQVVTPIAPVAELGVHSTESAAPASWSISGNNSSLDMTYDPFFQFQVPGDPLFGTWEVGNL